jgi:hypothetical protein
MAVLKRKLSDWISAYLEYTDESEPPISYNTWISISLLSASLQRRCSFRWGYETIYPNMYIVLVGPSGKCRKGTALRMGIEAIKVTKVKMVSESITREKLIRKMKESISNFTDPQTRAIKYHCSMTCISEELSVFLGQADVKFLADLTDWYDSKDKWTYDTKGSGTDEIQGLCFNLLGATAADWLVSILPAEAVGGGFTSRIIFVVEENKRRTLPEPIFNERTATLLKALRHDIEVIQTLAGRFVFSDDTKEMYTSWYQEQDAATMNGRPPIEDPRFAGYCERRATHLRKLCMIFSASRANDMLITPDDFERALNAMKAAEVKMIKVFGGLGSAKYSQLTEKILNVLSTRGTMTRSQLLLHFYRDLDMETLKIIEETLSAMKVVRIVIDPKMNGGDATYEYIKRS